MKKTSFFLFCNLWMIAAFAQNGQSLVEVTDLLKIKTAGNVAVSNDGSKAVFTLTSIEPDERSKQDYKYLSQLYTVDMVSGAAPVEPLFSVSNPALVIEAVKLAQDGSGDVVVRLYESLGERSAGSVAAHFPVSRVLVTDLLERPAEAPGVVAGGRGADLSLRPFQLVTLRFVRG